MKKSKICHICLRTDRVVKHVNYLLSEFHDQLCEYILSTERLEYCVECTHLLRKAYNFYVRCKSAVQVLKDWKNTKSNNKKPINLLYLEVPQSNLGMWTSESARVYSYIRDDQGNTMLVNATSDEVDFNIQKVSPENNLNEDVVTVKIENDNLTEKMQLNNEMIDRQTEPFFVTFGDERLLPDFHNTDDDDIKDVLATDILDNPCFNETTEIISNKKTLTDLANIDINDDDFTNNIQILNDVTSVNDVTDIDYDDFTNNIQTLNDVTTVNDVTNIDNDNFTNDVQTLYNVTTVNDVTNIDNDNFTNDVQTLYNVTTVNDVTDNVNDDFANNGQTSNDMTTFNDVPDDILKTEPIVDDDSVDISDIDEELVKSDDMKNDSEVSEDEEFMQNKMGAVRLEALRIQNKTKLKSKGERNKKIKKEGTYLKLEPVNIERLKEMLKTRFESCGELVSNDTKIDKQFILDNFPGELDAMTLNNLWIKFNVKQQFVPSTLVLLRNIQNAYKRHSKYKTVFDIEYLDSEEKVLEEFQKRKTYDCYVNAKFKCEICYQPLYKMVKNHKICHEESSGDFVCKICKVRYKTKHLLTCHMRNVHRVVYKCKLCPLITYYNNSMVNHYNNHKGDVNLCNICGVSFKSRSSYLTHRSKHSTAHACSACGRNYVSAASLKTHINKVHKDQPMDSCPVQCESCSLRFASLEALEVHSNVHNYVNRHRRQRTNPVTIVTGMPRRKTTTRKKCTVICDVCNVKGTIGGWLAYHYRNEHPDKDFEERNAHLKPYLCHYCAKRFRGESDLLEHLNTHTGVRPFACNKCPKRFFKKMNLFVHMYWHYPPTKMCNECGKKFHTNAALYNHKIAHIGNRRYKCKLCGKGFLSSATLNEHFRGVHLQVRRVKKRKATREEDKTKPKKSRSMEENSE